MREIVSYKLIIRPNRSELNDEINRLIQQGYQPYGSPSVTLIEYQKSSDPYPNLRFGQAVVQYKKEKQ